MTYTALGEKEVGSIVNLNEHGAPADYIIVHKGLPSEIYDASCDGVWLLRKDIAENKQWDVSDKNKLESSTIQTYLNGDWINRYDTNIRAIIKQVKIPYRHNGGSGGTNKNGTDGLSCKVFFLSCKEVGLTSQQYSDVQDHGEKLDYFVYGNDETAQAKRITKLNGTVKEWWLRDQSTSGTGLVWTVTLTGSATNTSADRGAGVRPALILPSSILVSEDGTVQANKDPTTPSSITIPENAQSGTSLIVTWGASTDPDNDLDGYELAGYELERQVDSGEWTQVYKGPNTSYTDTITRGWLTVNYRVRAYDSYGAVSDYITGTAREVNNNRAPTVTCATASGADLGIKGEGFTVSYSASDADGDPVSVTEAIDGVTLRTFTPEAGEACAFAVTGETFMKLLNGTHKLAITASDGQAQAVHTLTFTKSVTAASITLAEPMEADGPITLCVLSVTGSIPEDADYSVKVTNNALDSDPVWEDCTDEVKLGANHVFANDTAANGFAFNFLVSVERGESGQGGCINSVQGGFQ